MADVTDSVEPFFDAPPNPTKQKLITIFRALAAVILTAILADKLSKIGWQETWASLPTHPMFYILFGVIYAVMPLTDYVLYRGFWNIGRWALPAFLRKRIYNELVFDYSGEVFLFLWAQGRIERTKPQIASTVKDVNLLSGVTSNAVTLLLLGAIAATGHSRMLMPNGADSMQFLLVPVGIVLAMSLAVVLFRNQLFALTRPQALRVLGLHVLRLVLTLGLMAAQWWVALPEVSLGTWAVILTVRMLLTRLPFLPNQDVMFMWVAVSMAGMIDAPEAAVTSMFVAAGAMSLVTHAVVFGITALMPDRPRLYQR